MLSAGRLLCRTGLCPANRPEPRAGEICPLLRRSFPPLQQTFPMPFPPHRPPRSARFRPKLPCCHLRKISAQKNYLGVSSRNRVAIGLLKRARGMSERAGRAYGGNAGLAFSRDGSLRASRKALRTGRAGGAAFALT
jgi:hypothetical protein